MTEPTFHALTLRLDRLEKESARWRAAAVLFIVLTAGLVSWGAGATQPTDLSLRSLTIIDRTGAPRIRVAVDESKVAHIDLWGPGQRPVLSLYGGPAGGTVHVEGATPGTAAIPAAGASATLGLHTSTGNASVSIVREADPADPGPAGANRVVERASLSLDRGIGRLVLNDTTGTARAVLGDTGLRLIAADVTEQRQPPSIVLFDEAGSVLWKAP